MQTLNELAKSDCKSSIDLNILIIQNQRGRVNAPRFSKKTNSNSLIALNLFICL